jgi:hypothetical protein
MKKVLAAVLVFAAMSVMFSVTAFAEETAIAYYDESGNPITVNGLYYNNQGVPMYNAGCYYLDENGDPVYVGGCRAYYYDENGVLCPGSCYYDGDGNAVAPPASYPGGYGCGMWYYDSEGGIVNQATYYDGSGNPVRMADTARPRAGRGGCCGRW